MIKALLLTTLIITKISTAGKVLSGLLAGKHSEIRIRNEVLNTIFLLKCGAVIASCYNTKKVLLTQDFIDIKQLLIL